MMLKEEREAGGRREGVGTERGKGDGEREGERGDAAAAAKHESNPPPPLLLSLSFSLSLLSSLSLTPSLSPLSPPTSLPLPSQNHFLSAPSSSLRPLSLSLSLSSSLPSFLPPSLSICFSALCSRSALLLRIAWVLLACLSRPPD